MYILIDVYRFLITKLINKFPQTIVIPGNHKEMNDITFDMCQKLQKHIWNAYSFMHILETIFVWSVG